MRPDISYYRCQSCGQFLLAPFPHTHLIGSSTMPNQCPARGYQYIPAVIRS